MLKCRFSSSGGSRRGHDWWRGFASTTRLGLRATPIFVDVALHRLAHVSARLVGALLPGEDAGRHDPVEADLGERGEELVPVHLALADVQVLVDRDLRAGRIADVAQ